MRKSGKMPRILPVFWGGRYRGNSNIRGYLGCGEPKLEERWDSPAKPAHGAQALLHVTYTSAPHRPKLHCWGRAH